MALVNGSMHSYAFFVLLIAFHVNRGAHCVKGCRPTLYTGCHYNKQNDTSKYIKVPKYAKII